jgi:hypothetical protein
MGPNDEHVDRAFGGGGVGGIALADPSTELERRDFQPQSVAGSSARAITPSRLSTRAATLRGQFPAGWSFQDRLAKYRGSNRPTPATISAAGVN